MARYLIQASYTREGLHGVLKEGGSGRRDAIGYERKEGDQIIAKERPVGAFERQMLLGERLEPERLQASYEQGVLTIQIPVAPEAKPRRIEIRAGEGSTERQMIDVEGTKTQENGVTLAGLAPLVGSIGADS